MKTSYNSLVKLEEDCKTCELVFKQAVIKCLFIKFKNIDSCPCRMCYFKFKCREICKTHIVEVNILKENNLKKVENDPNL